MRGRNGFARIMIEILTLIHPGCKTFFLAASEHFWTEINFLESQISWQFFSRSVRGPELAHINWPLFNVLFYMRWTSRIIGMSTPTLCRFFILLKEFFFYLRRNHSVKIKQNIHFFNSNTNISHWNAFKAFNNINMDNTCSWCQLWACQTLPSSHVCVCGWTNKKAFGSVIECRCTLRPTHLKVFVSECT